MNTYNMAKNNITADKSARFEPGKSITFHNSHSNMAGLSFTNGALTYLPSSGVNPESANSSTPYFALADEKFIYQIDLVAKEHENTFVSSIFLIRSL